MTECTTELVLDERLLLARWEAARLDPMNFLRFFTFTVDQHDQVEPIKQFPWRRPHLYHMTRLWQHNPLLIVVKSRQMLMTWLFCALALWDVMFHPGRLVMLQSKREDDAIGDRVSGDGLLGRAKFIYDHIPGRDLFLPATDERANQLRFPGHNSTLWAIPQGAAIIRQRTASGIVSDEAAFQPEFGDSYVAARPTIRGGGWYVAVTTPDLADGGFCQRLYEDRLHEE